MLGEQFQQLSMFEPARNLRLPERFLAYDSVYGVDNPKVGGDRDWNAKLSESKTGWISTKLDPDTRLMTEHREPSLHESISKEGVHEPVDLANNDWTHGRTGNVVKRGTLMNGHHRVAAAHDIDPNMEVPVNWRHNDGQFGTEWDY